MLGVNWSQKGKGITFKNNIFVCHRGSTDSVPVLCDKLGDETRDNGLCTPSVSSLQFIPFFLLFGTNTNPNPIKVIWFIIGMTICSFG